MDKQTQDFLNWGVAFAIAWNVLILTIYSLSCWVEGVPFSGNIEVDSWSGFYISYALTTLVCCSIGYALRKEYITGKEAYLSSSEEAQKTAKEYQRQFVGRYAKMVTRLLLIAVFWYWIANIGPDWQTKDSIYSTILVVATLIGTFVTHRCKVQ